MVSHVTSAWRTVGKLLSETLSNNSRGLLRTPADLARGTECGTFLSQYRSFIQMRTNLKVVDNSGAKRIMCIQALKGKKGARLGDTIIASVKEVQPLRVTKGGKTQSAKEKVQKGDVVYAVVVSAAMQRGRCDGSEIKFDDNAAVLVNKQRRANWFSHFWPCSS